MTKEEAIEATRKHVQKHKTVHVTSDGSIFLNSNVRALEKHALEKKITLFHIKPEKVETKKTKKQNA